ncbi:MAG: 1,4-dihydroxy-2-naphthoate polyprenyltransferase [Microbacteriaceae bacterium]|nr:1,4-dihydroxy-2-naphthoate polyprenyltransferase [Microbacteriaceae bacterium]
MRKAGPGDWIRAARIPTLPLSVAPVVLGTAVAYVLHDADVDGPGWHWWRAAACLLVAVALQIGVNFANDYSDGIRGTDAVRSGPRRLTASGAAKPRTVLAVALVFFAIAAAAGLVITWRTGHWWFIAVGAACIVAAWFYTGGRRPYGYYALGEVAVFVFFGLVATLGTQFALAGQVTGDGWFVAVAAGAFATATILVANTRDLVNDARVGKRTLSVLIGDRASRIVYVVLLAVPYAVAGMFGAFYADHAWYAFFTLLVTAPAAIIALTARTPKELVTVLKLTALAALGYALLLGWAIAF